MRARPRLTPTPWTIEAESELIHVTSGLVGCMIAAVAWRYQATLLAYDADLDHVARIIGIEVDEASRHP